MISHPLFNTIYDGLEAGTIEKLLPLLVSLHLEKFKIKNNPENHFWDMSYEKQLIILFNSDVHTDFIEACKLIDSIRFKENELEILLMTLYRNKLKYVFAEAQKRYDLYKSLRQEVEKEKHRLSHLEKLKSKKEKSVFKIFGAQSLKYIEQEISEIKSALIVPLPEDDPHGSKVFAYITEPMWNKQRFLL